MSARTFFHVLGIALVLLGTIALAAKLLGFL